MSRLRRAHYLLFDDDPGWWWWTSSAGVRIVATRTRFRDVTEKINVLDATGRVRFRDETVPITFTATTD